MAELTVGQLIKLLLGVSVVVVVVIGIYLGFKENFFEFFKTVSVGKNPLKLIGGLIM